MATEVTKTIKPSGSGGHYTSLFNWEAGEQANLVTADEIAVAECYAMEDTTAVVIDGFTTDATRYIKIYTPPAERHSGIIDASPSGYYWLNTDSGETIRVSDNHVWIDGIYIDNTNSTAIRGYSWTVLKISNCVLAGGGPGGGGGMFTGADNFGSTNTTYLWNNVIKTTVDESSCLQLAEGTSTFYLYNNTLISAFAGNYFSGGVIYAENNLVYSSGSYVFRGTFQAATGHNATNKAGMGYTGADGTGDRVSQTFTFVDSGNGDYHLASNDAGAKGYGTADPGSGLFSDDIDGETRGATWDIGADQYVAAGGLSIPVAMHHYLHNFGN